MNAFLDDTLLTNADTLMMRPNSHHAFSPQGSVCRHREGMSRVWLFAFLDGRASRDSMMVPASRKEQGDADTAQPGVLLWSSFGTQSENRGFKLKPADESVLLAPDKQRVEATLRGKNGPFSQWACFA